MLPLPAGHVGAIGSSFGYSSALRRASADFIHCYAAGGTPIHPLPSLAPSGRLHPLPSSWRVASLFCFSCCCFCFYNVLRDSRRRSRSTDSLPLSFILYLPLSLFHPLLLFLHLFMRCKGWRGERGNCFWLRVHVINSFCCLALSFIFLQFFFSFSVVFFIIFFADCEGLWALCAWNLISSARRCLQMKPRNAF